MARVNASIVRIECRGGRLLREPRTSIEFDCEKRRGEGQTKERSTRTRMQDAHVPLVAVGERDEQRVEAIVLHPLLHPTALHTQYNTIQYKNTHTHCSAIYGISSTVQWTRSLFRRTEADAEAHNRIIMACGWRCVN